MVGYSDTKVPLCYGGDSLYSSLVVSAQGINGYYEGAAVPVALTLIMTGATLIVRIDGNDFLMGKVRHTGMGLSTYLSVPEARNQEPTNLWTNYLRWRRKDLQQTPRQIAGFSEKPRGKIYAHYPRGFKSKVGVSEGLAKPFQVAAYVNEALFEEIRSREVQRGRKDMFTVGYQDYFFYVDGPAQKCWELDTNRAIPVEKKGIAEQHRSPQEVQRMTRAIRLPVRQQPEKYRQDFQELLELSPFDALNAIVTLERELDERAQKILTTRDMASLYKALPETVRDRALRPLKNFSPSVSRGR